MIGFIYFHPPKFTIMRLLLFISTFTALALVSFTRMQQKERIVFLVIPLPRQVYNQPAILPCWAI